MTMMNKVMYVIQQHVDIMWFLQKIHQSFSVSQCHKWWSILNPIIHSLKAQSLCMYAMYPSVAMDIKTW